MTVVEFANRVPVDPNEVAHDEPPQIDLHSFKCCILLFFSFFFFFFVFLFFGFFFLLCLRLTNEFYLTCN